MSVSYFIGKVVKWPYCSALSPRVNPPKSRYQKTERWRKAANDALNSYKKKALCLREITLVSGAGKSEQYLKLALGPSRKRAALCI